MIEGRFLFGAIGDAKAKGPPDGGPWETSLPSARARQAGRRERGGMRL